MSKANFVPKTPEYVQAPPCRGCDRHDPEHQDFPDASELFVLVVHENVFEWLCKKCFGAQEGRNFPRPMAYKARKAAAHVAKPAAKPAAHGGSW